MLRSFRVGLAVACAAGLSVGVAAAQTVDEVVAKNLQARGGVEKLKAMTTTKMTGDVDQRGIKIHIVTWAKRPNLIRKEMDGTPPPPTPGRVSIPGGAQPIKIITAFDGNSVWVVNPMMGNGPQEITGPQADMAKGDDFDSVLLDYKAKGHVVELLGTETIGGKPAYHLKVTKKNGLIQHYYLDTTTGLEMRMGTTVDQGGEKIEVTTDLSNYQTVDGLTVPFSMRQSMNGTPVAEVTISKWEVNIPIDDEVFRMPGKK